MIKNHNENCGDHDISTIGTSNETHLDWRNLFQKSLFYFRFISDSEADIQIDNSSIGIKTTNISKQNPVCNGYCIISELEDVLKGGYYISSLDNDNVY